MARPFNPERLALARRRRGLTKVELAELVGLSARRLAAFENEGEVPPDGTLASLANALDFPEVFFGMTAPPDPSADGVSFRSFARLAANRRDAALAAAALAIELASFIDRRYELPAVAVPDLRELDAQTAALAIRSAWALGDKPLPNVVHLLEAHGVRVYSLVDECADLDALSFWHDGAPFVFLATHKSPERGRWDAAHELGHLVLHQGETPQGREQEREADEFASELLMPAVPTAQTAPRFVSLRDVREEKLRWRVSAMAYIRRLFQLGCISERQYKSLVVEATQAGYRRSEGDIPRETSLLIPKLLALMAEDGLSLADIASTLGITTRELRGLMFAVLRSVDGEGATTTTPARHLRSV